MELRSSDKIHLTEEQYQCFCKIAEHTKYVGKSFVKDNTFAYPKWQHLIEDLNSHPYFVWPTISGWLGALKLGLQELKCPMGLQLYNNIQKAYEYCRSVYNAQQKCRLQRRHDNIRVVCLVYFISLGEGLFQVSLNPPAGKKSSDMNLSHVWHRWLTTVKELNMQPSRRDEIYQSKVRKLAVEAKQVNRVGQAWPTQLPTMNHLIQSIPCDDDVYGTSGSQKRELPLGFEQEIQRAVSLYLVTAQKPDIKFNHKIRLNLGRKLQTLTRKKICKQICSRKLKK